MTKQPQITEFDGMNVIVDDSLPKNVVKLYTGNMPVPQMRRFFSNFTPGVRQEYTMTVDELLPHLKLVDKELPKKTADTFFRNTMWSPTEMKWIPTYQLKNLSFADRVFISAVAEITMIKRNK